MKMGEAGKTVRLGETSADFTKDKAQGRITCGLQGFTDWPTVEGVHCSADLISFDYKGRLLFNIPIEVAVAREVLRVEAEVEPLFLEPRVRVEIVRPFAVVVVDDVRLHAEYRLDLRLPAFVVEPLQREEVAVVGDGEGLHAHLLRLCDKRLYLALPVEERIRGVEMEMYEVAHCNVTRAKRKP